MAESRNIASCSSNQRKKTLSRQDLIDAIFEESSSSDKGENFCSSSIDKESDLDGDGEDVLRAFVWGSEPCFRESILHRDLDLQSNNKCDSDNSDDASDNNNSLDHSDSQSLPPRKQVRASTATKRGVRCSATKQKVLEIIGFYGFWKF